MKQVLAIIIVFIISTVMIVLDAVYVKKTFDTLQIKVDNICTEIKEYDIADDRLMTSAKDLEDFWTKKMDRLCISISRKDLQPISDYIQFIKTAIYNKDKESAITYSEILDYNVEGIYQSNEISIVNII